MTDPRAESEIEAMTRIVNEQDNPHPGLIMRQYYVKFDDRQNGRHVSATSVERALAEVVPLSQRVVRMDFYRCDADGHTNEAQFSVRAGSDFRTAFVTELAN